MRTTQELDSLLRTRQQIKDGGQGDKWIKQACARQEIQRLERGIYIASQDYSALRPWEKNLLNILVKFRASPQTVFSHHSAAALQGLPLLGNFHKIHVYCPSNSRGTLKNVVKHPQLTGDTAIATTEMGIRCTDIATTLIDCAKSLETKEALVLADSALFQRKITAEQLTQTLLSYEGRLQSKVYRVAQSLSFLSESPGETLTRLLLEEMEIRYVQQYHVGNYRVDFYLPDYGVFLEFDGAIKYTDFGPYQDVLREERNRERSFMNSGARIFRVTWEEVYRRPHIFKAQLRAFLEKVPS